MTRRTISTYVEINLDDFSDEDLIAELEDRRMGLDRKAIAKLKSIVYDAAEAVIETDMERATSELRAGRLREAILWLERALPREWQGRLT